MRRRRGSERAESSVEGRQPQTTAGEKLTPDRVIVTMPIHPLYGVDLPVVRIKRDYQHGGRYVLVACPRGGVLRLPLEWTDHAAPWVPLHMAGRPVRLAASGLLQLAAVVHAALDRALAEPGSDSPGSSSAPDRGSKDATTTSSSRANESDRRQPQRSPRRVGDARPQGASEARHRRRGQR
jgi:hypothetical protein